MYQNLKHVDVVARKRHSCDWCDRAIEKGEMYHYEAFKYDGEFCEWHSHLACSRVVSAIWDYVDPHDGMDSDQYYDFQKIGEWPRDVLTKEIAVDTILFRPKVAAVQPLSRSVKVLIDATTAARSIVVQYSVDGKTWTPKSYRNIGYKGPVTCTRKWLSEWHSKGDYYTSWCGRQFKHGGKTIAYKQTPNERGQMAQLYFDDYLIDGIRKKVAFPVLLNIPARAKLVRIRYAYTGLKKNLYSEWLTVKVR